MSKFEIFHFVATTEEAVAATAGISVAFCGSIGGFRQPLGLAPRRQLPLLGQAKRLPKAADAAAESR